MAALVLLAPAGCSKNVPGPDATASPAATEAPTPEPTPTPDPVRAEALKRAEEHGLPEEDVRGEYGLFLAFADAVDGNPSIGGYADIVYCIFPVIADNSAYIDTEHILGRLASLSFTECELPPGTAGQYRADSNSILISPDLGESDETQRPSVIFHELMHFIDFSASGEECALYLLDGVRLTADEFLALPLDDQIRAVILYGSDPVLEGCAELYTAKYFAGAVRSYFDACQFMTGLEYIIGTERMNELFFSMDSDALFAELFLDAGYSQDEYYAAAASLNWLTSPAYRPADYIRPEDILIDLYEHELGGGWQTDEPFLYVLKAINGIAWSGYEESKHAEFLASIEFGTWEQYEEFEAKVYADLPFKPDVRYLPPNAVIRDGRFTLCAIAAWTDPETQRTVHGAVIAEYDFDAEKPLSYEMIDMDAALEKYLGGRANE